MGWRRDWHALSDRIEALTRAAEVYAAIIRKEDDHAVQARSIQPELSRVRTALEEFASAHRSELPPGAATALTRYLDSHFAIAMDAEINGATLVVPLSILRSEFDYMIRDQHDEARSLTELAFEHLRRTIAVDDDARAKWRKAFGHHETSCEKLGAIHLLSHGIWAFKVSGGGSATDLVFGDPIERHAPEVQRTARALVATEWKLVKDPGNHMAKAAEARAQLKLYARGVLADVTLTATRFAVLVSHKPLAPLDDFPEDGVTYRHIAIAVDPDSPSVEARATARRTRR